MDSSQNAKSGNYHFQNESESHGGTFTTVNESHPYLAGLYYRNDGLQADGSTPNKRPRTHYGECGDLLLHDIEPDQVSSMDSHQEQSIVGVGDHNNTNYSNKRHENDRSDTHDGTFLVNNHGLGAPPWSMGLGEETGILKSDSTREGAQSELPSTATSRLVDERLFSQSLTYLEPNPMFVPPAGFCLGTSQPSGHVRSEFDSTSTLISQAPPDHSSFMGIGNDYAPTEISPDERITGIEFGHEHQCLETPLTNFSSHSHPGAPKLRDDSSQRPARHVNAAQLDSNMGPGAITAFHLHHPIVNTRPNIFASVHHQAMADPAAGLANMVIGVPHGAPIMSAPHHHANIQQLVHIQQMVHLNFQQVAQFQHFQNAMPIRVGDQGIASQGCTHIPFVAPLLAGPPLQPDSSQAERDQQQNINAADDKKSSHVPGPQGIPMSLQCDETRLSRYQTLIRQQFEFFMADSEDIQSGKQGRKKKLLLGQVGIRCIHCRHLPWPRRGLAAVYFPSTLEGVYQAAQNMASNHLSGSCHCMSVTLQEKLRCLRKESAPSSARHGKLYWAEASRAVGLVQTTNNGLRLKRAGAQKKQAQRKDVIAVKSQPKRG